MISAMHLAFPKKNGPIFFWLKTCMVCKFCIKSHQPLRKEIAYQYLCDWVTQHSNQLVGRSDTIEVLGALDGNRAYIIRSVFERILQDAGYQAISRLFVLQGEISVRSSRGRYPKADL